MAREVTVGIVVKAAVGAATTAMKSIGTAAKSTTAFVEGMAAKGTSALKAMGQGAVVLDHSMNLARKAWHLFDSAIGESIRTALDFRAAHDAAAKQIAGLGRNLELVRARLGDAFLPMLQGVADAMGPVLKSAQAWLIANRQLIGGKVIEWAQELALLLTRGVAGGVILVSRAWSGWREIIALVQAGLSAFWSMWMTGIAGATLGMAKLAEATGMDALASKMRAVSEGASAIAAKSSAASDANLADVGRLVQAQEELEQKARAVATTIERGIGQAAVAATRRLAESTAGMNMKLEDQQRLCDALDKKREIISKLETMRQQGIMETADANAQRQIELTNQVITKQEEFTARSAQMTEQVMASALQSLSDVMIELIQHNKNYKKTAAEVFQSIAQMVLRAALGFIIAEAAQAAASAYKDAIKNFGPIAGLAIGAGLAAAAFGAVYAMSSKVKPMAQGGFVTGGVPGRDSVPALLMPGEYVMSVPQVQAAQRGGMGGTTVNVTVQGSNFGMPEAAQRQRWVRNDLQREIAQAVRNRSLRFEPA